jgi:electron transport complex protein RnfC
MIHLQEHKQAHIAPIEVFDDSQKLVLPLSQHTGKPSKNVVQKDQLVNEGQLIAEADGVISANLHAPCDAKVEAITDYNHPLLGQTTAIVLKPQVSQEKGQINSASNMDYSATDIVDAVKRAGIVGMGGASFPTAVKLSPPKEVDTVIINGCECEPYLACDYRLMLERSQQILDGIRLINTIIKPKQTIVAVEDNKQQAIHKLSALLNSYNQQQQVRVRLIKVKSRYPQGAEKQLIYRLIRRVVPSGGLPFDVGCLVNNVATVIAVYQAFKYRRPLTRRVVTFSGDALAEPKNIELKIGTLISDLFEQGALRLRGELAKIIHGGPMMGITLKGLDYPIIKGSSGVLFFSAHAGKNLPESSCIRCGRCVDVCPVNLMPLEYVKRVKAGEFESLEQIAVKDCIECGSCSYVCPAKIPLVHYIKLGKNNLVKS